MAKKILVVEDEKILCRALCLKLQHANYEVMSASDGEEALKILGKNKFDLMLLDLIMPGMNGFAVLEAIKDHHFPIIVTSNLSQQQDFDKAKTLGATDFIVKSDTGLLEIVEKIRKILGD